MALEFYVVVCCGEARQRPTRRAGGFWEIRSTYLIGVLSEDHKPCSTRDLDALRQADCAEAPHAPQHVLRALRSLVIA